MPPVVTSYQIYHNDPDRAANLANLANIGVAVHKLIQLQDNGNPTVWEFSAAYYVGADGKRHAFPDSKTFFTWYPDFSSVESIAPDKLASIPMGASVHYKPGVKMIKFNTSNKVYAVSLGGQLHWIKTEEVAKSLYGSDWKTKVDDESDAFYADYTVGSDIASAADFNVTLQEASASQISADLGL